MSQGNRVIAIGLEAVEPTLIEQWTADGHLPTLKKFMEQGAYGQMRSPAEVSSGATWSTINCGVSPGKHGMGFCHRQIRSGTYDVRKKRADEVGRDPFWWPMSDRGRRSFVLDVPETRIKRDFNGTQITGWGLEYKAWHADSTPPGVVDAINREFGKNPLDGWYQTKPALDDYDAWNDVIRMVMTATERRTEIIKKFLREEQWDFALPVYAETHFAGHLFWHLCDPTHPEYREEYAERCGNPILEVYKHCDRAIAEFMEIDPDAIFMVVSNTGMGPNYSARHFVNPVLEALGYTPNKEGKKGGLISMIKPSADVYAVERFEKLFGTQGISRIKSFIPEKIWDTATRRYLNMGNNWAESIAFDVPGDNTGTVRINLKGREPKGRVEPQDFEKVCREIGDAFLELRLPDGTPAVREIVHVKKKYAGPNNDDLPDILIKWVEGFQITSVHSDRVGTITRDHLPDKRTGAHKDFGFLMAIGGPVQAGTRLENIYNWDVAPTVLALLDEPIPADIDGRPISGIVNGYGKAEAG